TDMALDTQRKIIQDFFAAERKRPFGVSSAPLWRMNVFNKGNDEIVFAFQCHHAIIDGWSDALLMTELNNLYLALGRDAHAKPTPLMASYRDFIIQHESDRHDEQVKQFWRDEIKGASRLDLFTHEEIPDGFYRQNDYAFVYVLEKAASQLKTSLKVLSVAAYLYTLRILTNDMELTAGLVTNTRPNCEGGDQILGCFLNTIPIRIDVDDHFTARDWVTKVHEQLVKLKNYERLSMLEISALHPGSAKYRNPFFDVIFNYVDFHAYSTLIDNADSAEVRQDLHAFAGHGVTNTLLDFTVNATKKSYGVNINGRRKLKSGISIERVGVLFFDILDYIVKYPEGLLGNLSMSTVEEQSRVLNEFNRPLEGRPVEATVAQCFEAQVSQSPTAVALVDEGVQYTYEQLHLRSNQVARHLRDICQVKAEDPVAIVLPRGEGMLTAMLGILKAGGAYVPIDPAYPRERIDYMLSDSRCKVVVDDALLATALNGQSHELLSVNDAGHLAYVIYTSGSTGKPKGVMVTHRNVVSFMENFPERFGLRPGMSIGATTNYTFDISVLELLCAVSCGLKVVLLPPSEPQAILTSVAEGQIDCLQVTPSRLTQLLTAAMGQIEALAKLKVLLVGGESLTPDHYDLLSSLPSTRVIHVYGPTETTIWSSSAEVSERVPLSLGTPLLRERIYVLRGDQLCPVGIAGEICISGSGVARGYLHRPEQTREKFVADPFVPGARLYRTGDMGRWNDRGQLIFLGRRDAQVKIRGYRIELGEVENALAGCAGVDAAVVQALPVNGEGLELVAYLVGTAPVDLPSVKEHLSRHLP
ncbi:MAG: non-ribosomal peptide synthetase, partial [Cyclobacteriaceae bacterium]